MALLVDLFGYLSIVIHGITIIVQSVAVGGVLFMVLLARPLGLDAAPAARIAGVSAVGLVLAEAAGMALQVAVLTDTVGVSVADALGANFALASLAKMAAGAVIAGALLGARRPPAWLLLAAAAGAIAAATLTTHAAARMADRWPLLLVEGLHQFGAAIWIGGLPCLLASLGGPAWRAAGRRYSLLSIVGVGCIVASGAVMSVLYIGSPQGLYGTAFGVMVAAKVAMLAMLLGLGGANFLAIRHFAGAAAPGRLKRFVEAEMGIGFSLFFAAAALTSAPPAVDLTADRVTWGEIVARNTPRWPRLASPAYDQLALSSLQAQIDREASPRAAEPSPAYVPGSGVPAARNAADVAWSEYNHHWAGLFVVAIGLLALAHRAGVRAARHWPLLFLGLAAFLFMRSDPEAWPLGRIGFLASFRDAEVLQHRLFVLLIVVFGGFEWRVRTGRARAAWAPLVFPLLTAAGGALLLTHTHAIANVRDQLLIEMSHTVIGVLGIAAGWARWLEIRLSGRAGRLAGWLWPLCFLAIGALLVLYREA